MSLTGPETSEYRKSGQAAFTFEMPLHCYLGRKWVVPWMESHRSSRRDERRLRSLLGLQHGGVLRAYSGRLGLRMPVRLGLLAGIAAPYLLQQHK